MITMNWNILIRLCLVLIGSVALTSLQIAYRQNVFNNTLIEFQKSELPNYLRQVFPESLFGDSWGNSPNISEIQKRISKFNEVHWFLDLETNKSIRIAVVKAGPAESMLSESSGRTFSVGLSSGKSPVNVDLVVENPSVFKMLDKIIVLSYFTLAVLFAWLLPRADTINSFPMARDMALIFDRKVSANKSWGIYCLSHLGGGGSIPGIRKNGFEACNNVPLIITCLNNVKSTYNKLRRILLSNISEPRLQIEFELAMNEGFCKAEYLLCEELPEIFNENDVSEKFRPFLYRKLLGFALLNLGDRIGVAERLGIDPEALSIERPAMWLIGGYEIYYPQIFLDQLIEAIRAGLVAAYGRSFESVRFFADVDQPFLSIDFICPELNISPENISRLKQYLASPFDGGLASMCKLMEGFGNVCIFDKHIGFMLTQRRLYSGRSNDGLVCRLQFRKISPEELNTVGKRMLKFRSLE